MAFKKIKNLGKSTYFILLLLFLYSCGKTDLTTIPTGKITGMVIDGLQNGNVPISGVTVYIDGYQNISYSATTGIDGTFSIEQAPEGSVTILAEHSSYITGREVRTVSASTTLANVRIPLLNASNCQNKYCVLLSWDTTPDDLDSYLKVPGGGSCSSQNVYYDNKGSISNDPFAILERDSTNDITSVGNASETIRVGLDSSNLFTKCGSTYEYYVHDYTNKDNTSSQFELTNAQVKIYYDGTLKETVVYSNSDATTDKIWRVFQLKGDQIEPVVINATDATVPTFL